MKYRIKALNIWELGQRANQEDSIFPACGEASENDRLFILCDGMGGHAAGEVASSTVCSAMSRSVLENCDAEGRFTDEDFAQALSDAFDALDEKDTGDEKKMGTTMTFLKLHDAGCTIAHMGDSRVYHIRPGKNAEETDILFQTFDHSLVNDLVKVGEITPEEARNYPQKNIITRAMQPNMERRAKADLYHTSDIQPGDYFFLCSDGILEQMEDDNLKFIFSEQVDGEEKKSEMLVKATKENKDNHSAILVHVLEVQGTPSGQPSESPQSEQSSKPSQPENEGSASDKVIEELPVISEDEDMSKLRRFIREHRKSRKYYMVLNIIVLVSFLALTAFFITHHVKKGKTKEVIQQEQIEQKGTERHSKPDSLDTTPSPSLTDDEAETQPSAPTTNNVQSSEQLPVQSAVSEIKTELSSPDSSVANSDQTVLNSDQQK